MSTSTGPGPASLDDRRDPCPVCDEPVVARDAYAAGGLERGSCRRCGLQLVRHVGDAWRQIRG